MRSNKPSSEVGLSRADRQGKCSLVIEIFFEISGNRNGHEVRKRKEHKHFIPFYVLVSFLVFVNTDGKVQTGATLF